MSTWPYVWCDCLRCGPKVGSLVGFGMWHPQLDLVKMFNRMRFWLDLGVWCPIGDWDALYLLGIMQVTVDVFLMLYVVCWVALACIGMRMVGVPMREGMVMYGRVPSRRHMMH